MGSTHLKSLNSLPLGHRFATEWGMMQSQSLPNLLLFTERLYFTVLTYYLDMRKPCPLAHLTRLYAKRWHTVLCVNVLPDITLRDYLHCCEVSGTLPIKITTTPRGGLLLLPNIVAETYWSRLGRGEAVPDLEAMLSGKEYGPELSELGIQLANAPFGDSVSDNSRHSDQKIDTDAKPAESVHFPVPSPDETQK